MEQDNSADSMGCEDIALCHIMESDPFAMWYDMSIYVS